MLVLIMSTAIRTPVHKRTPRHFLVDGLQVWVTNLDANENGPYGVRFMWLENQYSCSPLKHITDDGGYSFQKYDSYLMLDGTIDMRTAVLEEDLEKLNRLQRIWIEYQKKTSDEVFSV
jgi:hypothetical protein